VTDRGRSQRRCAQFVTLVAALVAGAGAASAAGPGVVVAMRPATQQVAPGATFDMSIQVTKAGSPFNAFDLYVGYDPKALTLLPQTPAAEQEGAMFAAACANRFHRFQAGAGADTASDVLLCAGVSLTGPGEIYKLKFRASATAQVTTVRFLPGLQFYDAGLFVNPDSSVDASIGIGVEPAKPRPVQAPLLRVAATVDSAAGTVAVKVVTDRDGWQRLVIRDAAGRLVRRLGDGAFASGTRTATWDGLDGSGKAAPEGSYVAEVLIPGRESRAEFRYSNHPSAGARPAPDKSH